MSSDDEDDAQSWAKEQGFDVPLLAFQIRDDDFFDEGMFEEERRNAFDPKKWWKILELKSRHKTKFDKNFFIHMHKLHNMSTNSAGIERIFSTFGIVWTKLRNRLGAQKAASLVRTYRYLRSKRVHK